MSRWREKSNITEMFASPVARLAVSALLFVVMAFGHGFNDVVVSFAQNNYSCPSARECPGPASIRRLCNTISANLSGVGNASCLTSWTNGFVLHIDGDAGLTPVEYRNIELEGLRAAAVCGECSASMIVFVFPDAHLVTNVGIHPPADEPGSESSSGEDGAYGNDLLSRRLAQTANDGSRKKTSYLLMSAGDSPTMPGRDVEACTLIALAYPACDCFANGRNAAEVTCDADDPIVDLSHDLTELVGAANWLVVLDNALDPNGGAKELGSITQSSFYSEFAFRHTFKPGYGLQSTCLEQEIENTFQVQFNAARHLVRLAGYWGDDDNEGRFVFLRTGTGVDVYILDSNVKVDHSQFRSLYDLVSVRVAEASPSGSYGFGEDEDDGECPYDLHATHVASLAGGLVSGVAKNSTIIPVKVNPGCGRSGKVSDLKRGLDWIRNRRSGTAGPMGNFNPSIVLVPIHAELVDSRANRAMTQLVDEMIRDGFVFVAAAGNQGVDACRFFPQSVPDVLTIGALGRDSTEPLPISNFGQCVNSWTTGESVIGASSDCDMCTATMTGTSQAAPLVAGMIAQFLQTRPSASSVDVKEWLHSNSIATNSNVGGLQVVQFDYRSTI